MEERDITHIHILCDNTSLIQSLQSRDPKGASSAVDSSIHALISHLTRHATSEFEISWVPSHEGIFGNERADRLAKQATRLPATPLFNRSSDYIRHRAKDKLHKDWYREMDQFRTTHPKALSTELLLGAPRLKLNPVHASPGVRRGIHTQLIRAITGHGRHAAFLSRIGSLPSPHCPCGAPIQDVRHIFCECPRHFRGRRLLRGVCHDLNLSEIFNTSDGLKAALGFLKAEKVDI